MSKRKLNDEKNTVARLCLHISRSCRGPMRIPLGTKVIRRRSAIPITLTHPKNRTSLPRKTRRNPPKVLPMKIGISRVGSMTIRFEWNYLSLHYCLIAVIEDVHIMTDCVTDKHGGFLSKSMALIFLRWPHFFLRQGPKGPSEKILE